ncbi:MAG: zinc-binding dehydrogenase [Chloroflexi bacterium]|nr:zinc-binding dehydrogenase [Chloroflexota bacterium]
MRALFFVAPGQLSVMDVPDPEPGPGDLIVAVDVALTCGTDLKAYLRGHRLFKPPMPFGHEFAGTVVRVGSGVDRFRVGDRVAAANSAPCGSCSACKQGETGLCDDLDKHLNWGAFAERARIPAPIVRTNTFHIPDHLAASTAAALEPLATVVHGVESARLRLAGTVAILGATGAIGQLFVQVLRLAGASRIIAVGRSTRRLAQTTVLGADVALGVPDATPERLRAETAGVGPDLVVDATGLPEMWELGAALARRGGTMLLFGGCASGTTVTFDTGRLHYDALTVRGVFHHTPRSVEAAFRLLAAGRVQVEPILEDRSDLEGVERLLERMARREIVKAAVYPCGHADGAA